jgi:decaprenylphospho-beta-D-erythro-pentofuranosid-2-ulose 2-reductase
MRKALILGATSAIAQETAKLLAAEGGSLFLVGRDSAKLESVAQDLRVRGARRVVTLTCDLNAIDQHDLILKRSTDVLEGLNTVLISYGTLSNQELCENSVIAALDQLKTNFLSVVSLLILIGNRFEEQRNGCIAVISSVAGDRGRQSNYVYGAAKGALTVFLSGLRNRLVKAGVTVITIKPGFVDSPMTASFRKGFLWASPAVVGRGVYRAIVSRKDVVYLPWYWRYIMMAVVLIPERMFKRLSL